MRVSMKILLLLAGLLLVLGMSVNAQSTNINGVYRGNDGGLYYLRVVPYDFNFKVMWFGEHPNGSFANVFQGDWNGDETTFTGRFWDAPKGGTQGVGNLQISIRDNGATLQVQGIGGDGFGGTQFTRLGSLPSELPKPRDPNFSNWNSLTDGWMSNGNNRYYLRQVGDELVWFGEAMFSTGQPFFANVFVGKRNPNTGLFEGIYVDLPKGQTRGRGSLTVRQDSQNTFSLVSRTGGFGESNWTRDSRVAWIPENQSLNLSDYAGQIVRMDFNNLERDQCSRFGQEAAQNEGNGVRAFMYQHAQTNVFGIRDGPSYCYVWLYDTLSTRLSPLTSFLLGSLRSQLPANLQAIAGLPNLANAERKANGLRFRHFGFHAFESSDVCLMKVNGWRQSIGANWLIWSHIANNCFGIVSQESFARP
jgi:hypothetical protein